MSFLKLIVCIGLTGAGSAAAAPPHAASTTRSAAVAIPDAERAQIAAATANAFVSLRQDVERQMLSPNLSIEQFIQQTGSRDQMNAALHRAEQIGGPRWIDDFTCQIRLEISGTRVVQTLVSIASASADRTPIRPDDIELRLRSWNDRTFAATGSSIRADMVTQIHPVGINPEQDAWRNIDDAARVAAIEAARDNAVHRVLDELRPVKLDDHATVGNLLEKNPQIAEPLRKWLRERPVTALQFQDDLSVRYTIALSRHQLFDQFVQDAQQANVKLPAEDALASVRDRFKQEIANTTGVAVVAANHRINPSRDEAAALIPQQPPDWIFNQIDASATAAFHSSPLQTKREAEDKATDAIRSQLLAMSLTKDVTIEQASKRSATISAAVGRAISRVRLYQVDYAADGSVTVKMMLDPREFWYDLSRP